MWELNVSICSLNEASESPEHHSAPSGEEKTNQGSKRRGMSQKTALFQLKYIQELCAVFVCDEQSILKR